MSDIRFNQWLHQSGTGGVSQVASGAVGVGTTNPLADFYVRGDAQITGILTAGHIAMGSSITFGDNDRAYFGDGTDLQVYHSGSHSYVVESGTGALIVNSNELVIKNAADNEDVAKFIQGNASTSGVELYFGNSKKFNTTNTGAVVTGILTATEYRGGGSTGIKVTSAGKVGIGTVTPLSELDVRGTIHALGNGQAALVWGNTTSLGTLTYSGSNALITAANNLVFNVNSGERLSISSSGKVTVAGELAAANFTLENDTGKLVLGAGSDLQLFHDGGSSIIRNINNNASLYIQASSTGTNNIKCNPNGSTQLWHNGAISLYTETNGLRIHDDVKLKFGNASDFEIYHNAGAHNYLSSVTGGSDIVFKATPSGGSSTERLRIAAAANGLTVYGNDNIFYGGVSGTNLNGDLTLRSTGTAVYQNLRFKSSDGSNQGSIVGYGGGAIMFFNASTFVWAINSQGERLELTNTALSPRANSTVLDLGTSSKRFRNIYTSDLDLSNESKGGNDVDGTWGAYTIQEGENDLFLINRRSGKKYKFNLTEVD